MTQACLMQITASRRRFPGVVAGLLAVATVAVLGSTGPATAVPSATSTTAGRIGPGTQLVTAGRTCTANFVFRDARQRVFLGYAASCATRRPVTAGNACVARSLPMGTRVRLADGRRTLGHGTLRYSSFQAQMVAGVTDGATCAANDFALVQVTGAAKRRVSSTVPYWNGPSGVATLPAEGATVFGLARSSASARALPRIGTVGPVGTGAATVSTPLPSTQRARGGGFLDDQGRAVGVLTRSAASGDNTVVSLADAVGYAAAHGVPGLQLVPGHGTFSGAAVV
jgi:hypothetical protein